MQVVFLGGAGGIGASCIAVQAGGRWLLVDAGVRMDSRADRLPDLAFLQDKPLAAIFVTHAHADHIGALPVVQQSFPGVPIYTARATMLLMEVMLADALQVMAKRADNVLEVPLYDEEAVAATLQMLRPLPLNGCVTIPELPDVTIYTARAGHVAGAVSLGFAAPDGRLVISGDVSITPQRTVPAAELIGLRHPDLLVLESTYGSRLHPNRQAEEGRLAQAVAEGIARGGHVLIPAFALGRAQEVLRILQSAQQRGQIPEFPVLVDGLVRRVCAAYAAIPEALTPALERQVRKGYEPFFGGMVRAVTDARQREHILQGAPACIVTSSGMLTGGPSAYYARHLAGTPEHSILITGYQDEESPGRRLLALADQGGGTLDIDGEQVTVRCQFARYSLSAHADGSELAGMVGALQPRTVALVHGDGAARAELAQRLERLARVLLPGDGQQVPVERAKTPPRAPAKRQGRQSASQPPAAEATRLMGRGVGAGQPLTAATLPQLWQALADANGEQVVGIRELALAWFGGDVDQAADEAVRQALLDDQPFFVLRPDLPGMVRVRSASELVPTEPGATVAPTSVDAPADDELRPGALVLLRAYGETLLPALCLDLRPETLRVAIPAGSGQRTRFPRASLLDVLGRWPDYPPEQIETTRRALTDLEKAALQWQRQNALRVLTGALDPEQPRSLAQICADLALGPDDLAGRLGAALLLNSVPAAVQRETEERAWAGPRARYRLLTGAAAEEAIRASEPRPDQVAILAVLDRHIGTPPDLYRRSINPETGAVTLAFHFPAPAAQQYGAALAAAAAEAGVPIGIAPQPHQGALQTAAHAALPPGLNVTRTSLHHERQSITMRYEGSASGAALHAAATAFQAQTGWRLEFDGQVDGPLTSGADGQVVPPAPAAPATPAAPVMDMHQATTLVKATFGPESGCYKVGADQARTTLLVRFHFPDVARQRYADQLARLSEETGWQVTVYPHPHQGQLEALARQGLPPGLEAIAPPSIYLKERQIIVRCRGTAQRVATREAEQRFAETTGWQLVVRIE